MANIYKNEKTSLTTTALTTLYTVPSNSRAIVKSLLVAEDAGGTAVVKVTLVEDPYFKEKNIFFDSMNFNKNSSLYAQRDNPFSRSNSIYIFPIKVVPFSQELLS